MNDIPYRNNTSKKDSIPNKLFTFIFEALKTMLLKQKKERGEEAYQFGFFFFGQLGHVPFDMFVDDIFER